jgi:heme/copper-type cytochrome/quinol oxidase subunit 3
MSSLAQPGAGHDVFEAEPPELVGRNLRTGSHLLASATAFFFLGFLFAYFYLRSLNSGHMWRPPHVGPSQALGALTMLALVGSAALVRWGLADERAGRADGWRLKGGGALVLGLASVVLQVAEWLTQGFGPASGGYASVYVGWTSFFTVFVLGALFWVETLVATSIRHRRGAPTSGNAASQPGPGAHDITAPVAVLRPSIEALSFYMLFLAGLGVLMWVVLYLV